MKYICNYTSEHIVIDGNLSKAGWKTANRVNLVDVVTGEESKQKTVTMLLWNEKFLYAAFECVDYEIDVTMKNYNDPLYHEDVVEIFIDDDCDKKTYIEIEINPNNAVLHYAIHNKGEYKAIYARIKQSVVSAVKREGSKTFYEIAIPACEFINEMKAGMIWNFNLYRIDRGDTDEYTALSPTGEINYHMPDRFAEIEFAEKIQVDIN